MPYGFQRITELTSIGLKTLNDQLEMIWLKLMGGVDYNESNGELKNVVDTITDGNNMGSYLAQTNEGVALAAGAVGINNLIRNGDASDGIKHWEIADGTILALTDTYEIYREVFEINGSGTVTFSQSGIECNPAVKYTLSFKGLLSYPATAVTAYVRGKKEGTSQYYTHKQVTLTPKAYYEDVHVSFETYTDESELEVIFSAEMAAPYALFYVTDIQIKQGGALTSFVKNNEEIKTNRFSLSSDGLSANVDDIDIEKTDGAGDTALIIDGDTIGAKEIYTPSFMTRGREFISERTNIYVSTSGSDANDGSSGSPYRTLQKAINMLPIVYNKYVNIYITQGTYFEDICIYGQNVLLNIYANNALMIGRLEVYASGCINFEYLSIQTTDAVPCVYAATSGLTLKMKYCVIDGVQKNEDGLLCDKGAKCYLDYTNFFYCNKAINANHLGTIFYYDNKGNNNNCCLYCRAGIIMGGGTCPTATTWKASYFYGQVNADNNMSTASYPLTNVSTYKWETDASDTATMIDGKFDAESEKIAKGRIKKYPDAFDEKTYGTERSGFWFFNSSSIVSALGSKTLYGLRFTLKRANYGGNPRPTLVNFYLHDSTSKSSTSQPTLYDTGVQTTVSWGEEASVFFPASIATYFKNGTYKGIAIKALDDDEGVAVMCPQSEYTAKLLFYYRD